MTRKAVLLRVGIDSGCDVVNPLNLSQWVFYVLSRSRLHESVGEQKSISLRPLEKLSPIKTNFNDLNNAIHSISEP